MAENNILPIDSELTSGPLGGIDANFSSDNVVSSDDPVNGLPPNTNGGDVSAQVDAATIGAYSPGGQQIPNSDVSYIQNQLDPLNGQPLALGDATQEMFTPGINQPLRVGGTSGQLTGSRDIFIAQNQAVPFALLERRRAAQQQAALKRSEDLGRFKLVKPKLSKDPRFNKNLVNTANDFTDIFVDRATKQFGSREAGLAALTNPGTKIGREYIQQMDNLEVLAGEVDQVVDLNAEVEKSIEEGDQFVSDETLKLHNDFKKLQGDFAKGSAFGAASFRDKLSDLQTSQSVDQYFKENDTLKNIEGEILQKAGVSDKGDSFRTTTRFTQDFEKGARAQAKAIKENAAFRNRENLSEEDLFKRIMALKGKVDKRTAKVTNKPKQSGFSDKSQVPISSDPKVVKVGDSQFTTKNSTPFSQNAQNKPIISTGAIVMDGDGNMTIREGQLNYRVTESGVLTDKTGIERRVVFGKEIINVQGMSKEEKQNLGVDKGSNQKTVEKDIILDFDNLENTLKGQSQDVKSSVEAFSDVSQGSKRQKQTIDNSNFEDYKKKFKDSGVESIREFNDLVKKNGIDIIMNEELRSRLIETSKKE